MQAEELGIKVYRPPTEMWGAYLTSDDEDSSDVRHVYRLVTYTPRGLGSSSIAIALNDFTPTLGRWDYKNFEICLPLREGDRLRVTRHGTNGWMQGVRASTGEKGWFPTSYVRVDKRAWNTNWLRRFDMSVVKGMNLGVNTDCRANHNGQACCVTDKGMRRLLGSDRFLQLQHLSLRWCLNITNIGVTEVARRCPHLLSLDLGGCHQISDAGLTEVGRGCPNLQWLNFFYCTKITDAGLMEVGRGCPDLQSINLFSCTEITNAGLMEVGRGCPNLQSLKIGGCSNITNACTNALLQSHPQLKFGGI